MADFYRLGTSQTLTASGTSTASAAFGSVTTKVRIASTSPVYFAVGTAPVATNQSPLLPDKWVDFITVNPGEKIAVLQQGAGGTVSITELAN